MKSVEVSRRVFVTSGLSALAVGMTAGCGAFRNAVNDRIDPIANPGNLDGKQFPVVVTSRGTGTVSGAGTFTGPFPDIAPVNRQNLLSFADFTQNLRGEIQLVPNPSLLPAEPLPMRLIVRGVSLDVRLYEGGSAEATATREVTLPALQSADNLVFDQVPGTNRYQWNQPGEIRLGSVRVGGDDAKRLFSLLTSVNSNGANTNFVSATLSASVDAEGVERGTGAVLFTFGKGEARVGL